MSSAVSAICNVSFVSVFILILQHYFPFTGPYIFLSCILSIFVSSEEFPFDYCVYVNEPQLCKGDCRMWSCVQL